MSPIIEMIVPGKNSLGALNEHTAVCAVILFSWKQVSSALEPTKNSNFKIFDDASDF